MPISFPLNPNGAVLGPGLTISWSSDFVGPLPVGSEWEIDLRGDGGEEAIWIKALLGTQSPFGGHYTPFVQALNTGWNTSTQLGFTIRDGGPASATVQLRTPTGVVDSGTLSGTWDARSGLAQDLESTTGVSGGFTQQDRLQLQAIETRSQVLGEPEQLVVQTPSGLQTRTIGQMLSRPLLDLLTLEEATSGPTSDPVRFAIREYYFGVIVRVTTIAEDLVAKTPDLEWYFPDLAVLRVFRGADLQFRRGIHTPTFMTEHPWEWGLPILNQTDILGIPPDVTIAVDWRAGCAGQVFLQRFP